jgi:Ala-tRNA(Pro) deacylase
MCIRDFLEENHLAFEVLIHGPAPSATRRAHSVHVSGGRVAKAVLVRSGEGFVLVVLPATHRIDLERLAEIVDSASVEIADEDAVESIFFDCERGALPPFGRLYGLPTIVDESLAQAGEIVFEGNSRNEDLAMSFHDFEAAERPRLARFASPIPAAQLPTNCA